MFSKIYQSGNRDFILYITIKCSGKKTFRVWAEDQGKKNSKYADRQIDVDGKRTIYFSFPVTPKQLFLGALNTQNPKDADYEVELIEAPLKTYNIWMEPSTEKFLQMAINFCQVCGFENASDTGRFFKTSDDQFRILFLNQIFNRQTGTPMNTPASIGHETGIIQVAKSKMDGYTIPMRIMIMLHEYSHKYKNPKIGLPIDDEVGADINGLYIYLGLGFSKIDAICVFANVFLKAQTKGNIIRMRKIMDYINRFENGEYAKPE